MTNDQMERRLSAALDKTAPDAKMYAEPPLPIRFLSFPAFLIFR